MKRLLILLMFASPMLAQVSNPSIILVSGAPSGACTQNLPDQQVITTGKLYSCQSGTWTQITGGGGGGITALTQDVTASGTGSVAATVVGINDTLLSGLASGLYYNTTITGVPSIASSAQILTACTGCAPLASPTFTGNPTAPTQTTGDNSTKLATDAFVIANAGNAPTVSAVGGDLACAMAGDTTINQRSITGGSSTSSTMTVSIPVANYWVGEIVSIQGATPSGFNGGPFTVSAISTTQITVTSTNNPGAWVSGGTVSKYCANQTNDAIAATPYQFANTYPTAANFMAANLTLDVQAHLLLYTQTAVSIASFKLYYLSTSNAAYFSDAAWVLSASGNNTSAYGGMLAWSGVGLSATSVLFNLRSFDLLSTSAINVFANSATAQQPLVNLSTGAGAISASMYFSSTGVVSGTYTSGGTITGTSGQTCTLATFNDSSTATATVTLTGTNVIAGGTALTITARGGGATAAPTSATLGSGTATCSGTATIATVLGGSPGIAVEMMALTVRKN